MDGYPGNKFMPNKPITRAEMAVLADKLDDNVNKENKNELIGTVRKIEIDENTITIKNNYGRKTYKWQKMFLYMKKENI